MFNHPKHHRPVSAKPMYSMPITSAKTAAPGNNTLMNLNNYYKILVVLSGIFCLSLHLAAQTKAKRPNIVLILADDMGYSDLGCFGSEINTPNLDKLAGEGLKITQFYNAGRCCPSRAALLTGLYPHQAGVGDMLQNDSLPGYGTHLNFNSVTLAEVLKEAGYHTIISGKWHAGNEPQYWPTQRGFTDQYFSNNTTGHYFGISKGRQYIAEGKNIEPQGQWIKANDSEYQLFKNEDGSQWYATDAIATNAIKFVKGLRDKTKEQPFFLYLPFTAPHWPLHAFEEDIAKYQGKYLIGWDSLKLRRYQKLKQLGLIDSKWQLSERNENVKAWSELPDSTKKYYDRLMAVYAAMIDRLDRNIGRVLQTIKETGDTDNTVVIFLSDNGGCHEIVHKGSRATADLGTPASYDGYEYSWASASNTPFKWFKHWSHEGGISTPFIAWYPSLIKPSQISHQVGYVADIMPTLVELSGAKYPTTYKNQAITPTVGKSLVPIFKNPGAAGRGFTWWEHEGNRAVRKGYWKIVSRYDYKTNAELPWELYNLKDDRSETKNLSQTNPEKLKELIALYTQWASKVQAVPYTELQAKRKKQEAKTSKE